MSPDRNDQKQQGFCIHKHATGQHDSSLPMSTEEITALIIQVVTDSETEAEVKRRVRVKIPETIMPEFFITILNGAHEREIYGRIRKKCVEAGNPVTKRGDMFHVTARIGDFEALITIDSRTGIG